MLRGQTNLINKLDELFSIPETGQHMGSIQPSWGVYSFTRETRDVGFGQCVITNQPSHHLPYVYAEAGRPSKTQGLTREMLHRLFTGSDIGQGYCGDEDNGEMSSWYILSMLGLYNIALGKNEYVITSPMLNNVIIKRDNGNKITIKTDDKNGTNYYIRSAELDDSPLNQATLNASSLLSGNHTLSYKMSRCPTSWGNKTINGEQREFTSDKCLNTVFVDQQSNVTNINNLTDGNATTIADFSSDTVILEWLPDAPTKINTLGLTSANSSIDFHEIKFEALNGNSWQTLTELHNQSIDDSFNTRIYSFANASNYSRYRLILFSKSSSWSLGEIQLI